MVLGAGRERVDQDIDYAVGAVILVPEGAPITAGEPLVEVHYRDRAQLEKARELLQAAYKIGDSPPASRALVLETMERHPKDGFSGQPSTSRSPDT